MKNFPHDTDTPQNDSVDETVGELISPAGNASQQTIRECVKASLQDYFDRVELDDISNLYELVLSEVEAPLLQTVMRRTRSNQSKASAILGLNRGTLRKKLKKYDMLN